MKQWQRVWRDGIAPQLSNEELAALESLLAANDVRLLQGMTCYPPYLDVLPVGSDHNARGIECGCPITMALRDAETISTVGEAQAAFHRIIDACDAKFGEAAACRWWLSFWDDGSRKEVVPALLAEVRLALAARLPALVEA